MEKDKIKFLIEMINKMNIKDKLRLAIRMSEVITLISNMINQRSINNLILC